MKLEPNKLLQKRIKLEIIDLNQLYYNSVNYGDTLLLSDIDSTRKDYRDILDNYFYSFKTEKDFIPSCDCGELSDIYYDKDICQKCGTQVLSISSKTSNLPSKVWIKFPNHLKYGVLHPTVYSVLSNWLNFKVKNQNKNYLDIILNPEEHVPIELESIIQTEEHRGFNFLFENFDMIIDHFCNFQRISIQKKEKDIREFIETYKDRLFTHYIPALPNALHPVTSKKTTNTTYYVDIESHRFLNAAQIISRLNFTKRKSLKLNYLNERIYKAYKSATEYSEWMVSRRLFQKKGLIRKHICGTRFHFSFRSVIAPICGPHKYDELILPWSIGVTTLKLHIMNRLMHNYNYSLTDAIKLYSKAEIKYDPLIYSIIKSIINEYKKSSDGISFLGIPVLFNRNPTVRRGATQLLFVTDVKKDVEDKSINISVLILPAPNADFDGDAMNGLLLIEKNAVMNCLSLHPSVTYLSSKKPSLENTITLPKQARMLLTSYQDII